MFEVWGGSLDSLSFYDGGPAHHLEDCDDIVTARNAVTEWHSQNYAAWVQDKETQQII